MTTAPEIHTPVTGEELAHVFDEAPPPADLSVYEAFRRIYASSIPYDQLLLEGRPGHEWIHVSTAPVMYLPRREALVSADGVKFTPYQPETLA